ncbi:unnamed protein product [Camellia sinensis]
MGEGRERRLGGNRFFLLWRHPPDPDVVCADSAAGDWEVTGDFKNMSIFATIDKLYPPDDWLVGSSLPSKFSPTIIESTLNELTPNNVRHGVKHLTGLQRSSWRCITTGTTARQMILLRPCYFTLWKFLSDLGCWEGS